MKRLSGYAIVVLVLVVAVAIAQERFDYKVRSYFFAGYAGDNAALQKGMKICEDALATDPKNAEALVWHGSGIYYQAFVAFQQGDQQKGMELAQRGGKEMDDAVAMAPDSLGVRIPRGAFLLTSSHFVGDPGIAKGMIAKGISDLERAYAIQEPNLSKMGVHPKGELFIGLADGYSRLGQQNKAEDWFKRIATEMKGTPYEASADLWLRTRSLAPEKAGCIGCHTGN
jgi:tetratricopeptide (TPR) repeat protein